MGGVGGGGGGGTATAALMVVEAVTVVMLLLLLIFFIVVVVVVVVVVVGGGQSPGNRLLCRLGDQLVASSFHMYLMMMNLLHEQLWGGLLERNTLELVLIR